DTGRMAFGPEGLYISKVVQEHKDLHLQLERTGTLTVNVYLPKDDGTQGELAPLVDVTVSATDYFREAQGQSLQFPRMIPRYSYGIEVRELGGEYRTVKAGGKFPAGALTHTQNITLPSTGTVEVTVLDGSNKPVGDAEVTLNGRTVYTPLDGKLVFTSIPFGWVSVYAKKNTVAASAGGDLRSRSVPLKFTLNLGETAAIAGEVEAEEGIGLPSVGTRVLVTVNSPLISSTRRLETLTDAQGKYVFSGIPIGSTRVDLIFYGPDDTTIGHEMSVNIPNGTTGTYQLPKVKVDATPPRVLSIDPPANSTNVAPTSPVTITFSEPIASSFLTTQYFKLIPTDTSQTVNVSFEPSVRPDGTYQVKMIAPEPPAGQRFPLKSNLLYRIAVVNGIQDTTGNALKTTVGSSFTTLNYTEPTVVRVDPDFEEALPSNASFRVKFNKPIDLSSLEPGYGGVFMLERLDTRNGNPIPGGEVPLMKQLDPEDPTVILAGPHGVAIAEAAFYRLTVSGVRDLQTPPNVQKDPKIVDFFSYDTRRPIARIVSPVGESEPLVAGLLYTAGVSVVDEGTGTPSIDVDSIDWFDADGKYLKTITAPPYSYSFRAPVTATPTTYTLMVSANDLSLNRSPQPEPFTWNVIPNAAPTNITVTNTPASAYPTQKVHTVVTFTDEGLKVTANLKLVGKRLDGSDVTLNVGSKLVERPTMTSPWPEAAFDFTLPLDLQP
ncbi:MAG: Ig-like domain-containing protein, partial [Thermoanaerobaculia bacterium]